MTVYDINSARTKPEELGFSGYWYLQYCLTTGLYMLEPWERKLFNTITGLTLAFICVVCVPITFSLLS